MVILQIEAYLVAQRFHQLPEPERSALALFYLELFSVSEIGPADEDEGGSAHGDARPRSRHAPGFAQDDALPDMNLKSAEEHLPAFRAGKQVDARTLKRSGSLKGMPCSGRS
jgi:hypothetical protein